MKFHLRPKKIAMVTSKILILIHLIGLALALGSASIKVALLWKCRSVDFVPSYLKVVRPITRLLILGLILMTVSGVTWLFLGYPLTNMLIVKIILVSMVWIIGPMIDNTIEPKFVAAVSRENQSSEEVKTSYNRYFTFELVATSMFYAVTVLGILI